MNKVVAMPPQSELLTIDPPTYVAAVYEPYRSRLAEAISATLDVKYNIATKEGMQVAKQSRALFRDIRIEGEKERAARKAPIISIGKLLDSEYKDIAAAIAPHEEKFDADIKAEEQRIEDEKAAKIKAEAERAAFVQGGIDKIKNAPLKALDMTSAGADELLAELESTSATKADFDERYVEAEEALKASIAQLKTMIDGKRAQEQLAAQQEAQRVEQEAAAARLKAEQEAAAKKQREEQEAAAAKLKAEQEEFALQQAEFKRQQEEFARQREAEAKNKAEELASIAAQQSAASEANIARDVANGAGVITIDINDQNAIGSESCTTTVAHPATASEVIEKKSNQPTVAEIVRAVIIGCSVDNNTAIDLIIDAGRSLDKQREVAA